MNWILENKEELIAVVTGVVTLASAICALTPTPKDDAIVGRLYKLVEALALNVGKAKQDGNSPEGDS